MDPIQDLEQRLQSAQDPLTREDLQLRLAQAWGFVDPSRGRALAEEVLASSPQEAARAHRVLTWNLIRLHKPFEALEHYEEALRLAEENDPLGVADALLGMGILYDQLEQFERALQVLARALSLYRELGSLDGETVALRSLGVVRSRCGQAEEALGNYRESLELDRRLGQEQSYHLTLNNIGINLKNLGRLEEAELALSQALQYFRDQRLCYPLAGALHNLGLVYLRQEAIARKVARLSRRLCLKLAPVP